MRSRNDVNYYRSSNANAIDIAKTDIEEYAVDRHLVIKPLPFMYIDRFREPPAAFRVNLVPEELHDVRGRCADAPVSNSLLLGAEKLVTKSPSDKSIGRSISDYNGTYV